MRRKFCLLFLIFLSLQLTGCSRYGDTLSLQAGSSETAYDRVDDRRDLQDPASDRSSEASHEDSHVSDTIFVHICGEISHPGVYEMKAGSRIYELVNQAGGLTEEASLSYLNQAQILQDGQQIYIPAKTEAESGAALGTAGAAGSVSAGTGAAKVNINTADQATLETITGIGASRARDILTYRESNGPFATIEEIMQVPGIKNGLFAKIKDQICVQ